MKFNFRANVTFIFILVIFSFALFLPFVGKGYIHDDFLHISSVAYQPLKVGLMKATGGDFYAPLAWVSFKIDWLLWGQQNPFPYAFVNLLIHIINTILLFCFAKKLWHSNLAAWWTAFGFALLFPANIWAVMWIATRAHLLATFFYLSAMLATLWLTRVKRYKILPAIIIVVFAALSLFSKESGITLAATIVVIIIYERTVGNIRGKLSQPVILIIGGILIVFAAYFALRSQSGAVSITVGGDQWYSYKPSLSIVLSNLGEYGWRTYGLLLIIAAGICLSKLLNRQKLNFNLLTKNELMLSFATFFVTISPFILLAGRSGIYTYLPGVGASLLLGAMIRSLYQPTEEHRRTSLLSQIPIAVSVIILVSFTIGQSQKWVKMARTNMSILSQIAAQEPKMPKKAFVVIRYSDIDVQNKFPDGFGAWSFSSALQLKFDDPSLSGIITKQEEPVSLPETLIIKEFIYTVEEGNPKVIEMSDKVFLGF